MELISSVTVGSGGAATIDFTSIPQTYTELMVLFSGRSSSSDAQILTFMYLNGDTTNGNYATRRLWGNGSSASSSSNSYPEIATSAGSSATASTFGNVSIYLPNYTGSANKTFSTESVSEDNASAAYQSLVAGRWNNSAAVTSIKIDMNVGLIIQHSTAYLYGILQGSGGATVS
jgi:hypothetical protein